MARIKVGRVIDVLPEYSRSELIRLQLAVNQQLGRDSYTLASNTAQAAGVPIRDVEIAAEERGALRILEKADKRDEFMKRLYGLSHWIESLYQQVIMSQTTGNRKVLITFLDQYAVRSKLLTRWHSLQTIQRENFADMTEITESMTLMWEFVDGAAQLIEGLDDDVADDISKLAAISELMAFVAERGGPKFERIMRRMRGAYDVGGRPKGQGRVEMFIGREAERIHGEQGGTWKDVALELHKWLLTHNRGLAKEALEWIGDAPISSWTRIKRAALDYRNSHQKGV